VLLASALSASVRVLSGLALLLPTLPVAVLTEASLPQALLAPVLPGSSRPTRRAPHFAVEHFGRERPSRRGACRAHRFWQCRQ
jgi:hypothetical protein